MKNRRPHRLAWLLALYSLLILHTTLAAAKPGPAQQYCRAALQACDIAEAQMPEMIRVAEIIADRHIAGGMIGFPRLAWYQGHGLEEELWGRSGQIVHVSYDRPFKKDRTDAEKASDILIMGWRKDPNPDDLQLLQSFKAKHCYIVGFGPRGLLSLAQHIKLCDAWFDTRRGTDDRVVKLAGGARGGRTNLLGDVLNAWPLMGEIIAALTRRGKMPTIGKAFLYEDGLEWWNKYFQKQQFHDDYQVPPIPAGQLARAYLNAIRGYIRQYERTQIPEVHKTVDLIVQELKAGRKTVVSGTGHMAWAYAGRDEATSWSIVSGNTASMHYNLPGEVDLHLKNTPDEALVLRIGYAGHHVADDKVFRQKRQRVMMITAENPRPELQLPKDLLTHIDMGFPFGDAVVTIPNYPIRALPPSGVMQIVAYESVNVEVLARIAREHLTVP